MYRQCNLSPFMIVKKFSMKSDPEGKVVQNEIMWCWYENNYTVRFLECPTQHGTNPVDSFFWNEQSLSLKYFCLALHPLDQGLLLDSNLQFVSKLGEGTLYSWLRDKGTTLRQPHPCIFPQTFLSISWSPLLPRFQIPFEIRVNGRNVESAYLPFPRGSNLT